MGLHRDTGADGRIRETVFYKRKQKTGIIYSQDKPEDPNNLQLHMGLQERKKGFGQMVQFQQNAEDHESKLSVGGTADGRKGVPFGGCFP